MKNPTGHDFSTQTPAELANELFEHALHILRFKHWAQFLITGQGEQTIVFGIGL